MENNGAKSSTESKGDSMFGWFKQSPEKKIQKQITARYAEATQLQRNGKLREYAAVMTEISKLEDELQSIGGTGSK